MKIASWVASCLSYKPADGDAKEDEDEDLAFLPELEGDLLKILHSADSVLSFIANKKQTYIKQNNKHIAFLYRKNIATK